MNPEDAKNFERTLELGKEIANDLSDSDVLGRWMAHHIGALIVQAENATGAEANGIRREAMTAILALWNHRSVFSSPTQPLDTFEPVFRALERLSEPQDPWSFYRMFQPGREPSEDDMVGAPLLRIALELEETVRSVTREIVAFAAQEAADKEAKWLKLSEHLEVDEQRAARDALLRLARTIKTYTDGDDGDPATGARLPKLIAALQHAGSQLADARVALEGGLPAVPLESKPDGPA
ncbi:hypothetical protein [Actinomadura macra]|uniref:hypothetical protein n=1 Tax=Actinomadura macra TaxID=46164 RepID=UPI0012F956C9|nr:hypothetical protein [Actinomadura macra]